MKILIFLATLFFVASGFSGEKGKDVKREPAEWANFVWKFQEKTVTGGKVVCGVGYMLGFAGAQNSYSNSAVSTSCVFVPEK